MCKPWPAQKQEYPICMRPLRIAARSSAVDVTGAFRFSHERASSQHQQALCRADDCQGQDANNDCSPAALRWTPASETEAELSARMVNATPGLLSLPDAHVDQEGAKGCKPGPQIEKLTISCLNVASRCYCPRAYLGQTPFGLPKVFPFYTEGKNGIIST